MSSTLLQSAQLIQMGLAPDNPANQEPAHKHGVELTALRQYYRKKEFAIPLLSKPEQLPEQNCSRTIPEPCGDLRR